MLEGTQTSAWFNCSFWKLWNRSYIQNHLNDTLVFMYYYPVLSITSPLHTQWVPSQSHATPFTPSRSNYYPTFCVNNSPGLTFFFFFWCVSHLCFLIAQCFPDGSVSKESTYNAGDTVNSGSITEWGRSPGGGNGSALQYSCLKNPLDREAW